MSASPPTPGPRLGPRQPAAAGLAGAAWARLGWPTLCIGCGQWAWAPLCGACRPRSVSATCRGCGRPWPGRATARPESPEDLSTATSNDLPSAAAGQTPPWHCGHCLRQAPPWRRLVAASDYRCPWPQWVARLKYQQQPELAGPLAVCLAEAVAAARSPAPDADAVQAVLPMPLSRQRLAHRGYNQAWELARRVARIRGLPAWPETLLRWRDTPPQVGQDRAARLANLADAFWVPAAAHQRLRGTVVALVDDVTTTGATAAAATHTLLQAGAAAVELWVLARAPAPGEDGTDAEAGHHAG